MINIYVGNLPYRVTEDGVRQAFEKYGEVGSIKIVKDRETGRSKGFCFVEMTNDEDGKKAIAELNGFVLMDRELIVNEARPRETNPQSSFGGGGGGQRRYNNNRY